MKPDFRQFPKPCSTTSTVCCIPAKDKSHKSDSKKESSKKESKSKKDKDYKKDDEKVKRKESARLSF